MSELHLPLLRIAAAPLPKNRRAWRQRGHRMRGVIGPLVLLVVIVLAACGTTSVGQPGTEAATAAAGEVIWEEDRAGERTFDPGPVTGVVTIGRARAVAVGDSGRDATRGVVTEAVLLGEGSGGAGSGADRSGVAAALRL